MRDDRRTTAPAQRGLPKAHATTADTSRLMPTRADADRLRQWRDALILKACALTLRSVDKGRLRLTMPTGQSLLVGKGQGPEASLTLEDFSVFRRALRRGSLGFAEAYIDGTVHTPDLGDVFRFFLANRTTLQTTWRGQFKVRRQDRQYHAQRANTPQGSKANISAHYDLGNSFYERWLDSSMTYSSALYQAEDETLEHAQDNKLARIVDALSIAPGHRVLEIGCGWGALAIKMAEAGAVVTAVTISEEQFKYTRDRVAAAGLSDRIDTQLIDYRNVTGTFDRIVSIEMIEAVGEENWSTYFRTVHDRLAPGGHAVLQAITIAPQHYENYRAKADFIQRYIFPGGMLPTENAMQAHAAAVTMTYAPVLRFGPSYARTLAEWRHRFITHWPQLRSLGFNERFHRMWVYYLTYCEVGFEQGTIDVGLYRFDRPAETTATDR